MYDGTDFLLGISARYQKKYTVAKRSQVVITVEEHPTGCPHNPNTKDIKKVTLDNRIFRLNASFRTKTM